MSFKDWRRISVDGLPYRWMVEDKQSKKGANTFQRIISIRSVTYPNSKCSFVSDEVGYFWLWSNSHSLVVTPKLVAACISYALQNGWKPEQNQSEYSALLSNDLVTQLLSSSG